jgi:glycosyltransferase involved in cell wall biosynthesis
MYSCNVLILTNWPFEDALIQAYTLPYVKIIRKSLSTDKEIWFQTLEKVEHSEQKIDSIKNILSKVKINWVPQQYHEYGIQSLLANLVQLIKYVQFCREKNIKLIHIWCTPPGIIGYILSVLAKADLIIDSFEPHAETMVENGSWKRNGIKFRVLFYFEKLMSRRAKVLIAAAQGMKDYAKLKYRINPDHFYVKPACVDLELFNFDKRKNLDLAKELALNNKIVLVYAGKFGGIYLDKEIFDFIKVIYDYYDDKFRFLLLTSHGRNEIESFCKNVGLPSEIVISRFVDHSEIPYYIGLADFAFNPVKPVPTKLYCTPAKDGEYWAMGLPIIITKGISDDSSIIKDENIGVVIEDLNNEGYKNALKQLNILLDCDRNELSKKIRAVAIKYRNFDIANKIYSRLYH